VVEQPLSVEIEQEADGRWLAEVVALPRVLAFGVNREEALARVETLALRVIADGGPRMLARMARVTGLEPDDL
jgi:hypothetical protein